MEHLQILAFCGVYMELYTFMYNIIKIIFEINIKKQKFNDKRKISSKLILYIYLKSSWQDKIARCFDANFPNLLAYGLRISRICTNNEEHKSKSLNHYRANMQIVLILLLKF